ncbi:MAG: Asp-tRNA(Asn)/Glu-tRNA(Gln) amidotransferase subunit GatA [Chitinophagaceae bacterium]
MYHHDSIAQFHLEIDRQTISCESVVADYLHSIQKNSHLNAFIEVFNEEALERARQLDLKKSSGKPVGRLFGVVIGIKDVICFKGHQVTAASKILKGFTSLYSATAIERLLNEDAIIIGNLNCDEFAMGSSNEHSAYGKVLNALDETRVPGGSSGGSAVAVQAGLCMVSLGSDTGGSVRQPADFCGIIGLKPSYGRISRYGLLAYASSFDQIGIFATNIADTALILEIMAGEDEFDSTVSKKPVPSYSKDLQEFRSHAPSTSHRFKIAYFPESIDHPHLDPEIKLKTKGLLDQLQSQGHTVEPVPFELLDYIVPAYYIMRTAEASSNLSRYDGVKYGFRSAEPVDSLTDFYEKNRSAGFGKEVKRRIMLGNFVLSAGFFDAYFTKAQQVRTLLIEKTKNIFSQYDILVMPTVTNPAFRFSEKSNDPIEMYLGDLYTVFANLTGIPGISIPLFKHSNGMPFGIQFMSNQFDEVTLLRFSDMILDINS